MKIVTKTTETSRFVCDTCGTDHSRAQAMMTCDLCKKECCPQCTDNIHCDGITRTVLHNHKLMILCDECMGRIIDALRPVYLEQERIIDEIINS